jgi:hypothetical protein
VLIIFQGFGFFVIALKAEEYRVYQCEVELVLCGIISLIDYRTLNTTYLSPMAYI